MGPGYILYLSLLLSDYFFHILVALELHKYVATTILNIMLNTLVYLLNFSADWE